MPRQGRAAGQDVAAARHATRESAAPRQLCLRQALHLRLETAPSLCTFRESNCSARESIAGISRSGIDASSDLRAGVAEPCGCLLAAIAVASLRLCGNHGAALAPSLQENDPVICGPEQR